MKLDYQSNQIKMKVKFLDLQSNLSHPFHFFRPFLLQLFVLVLSLSQNPKPIWIFKSPLSRAKYLQFGFTFFLGYQQNLESIFLQNKQLKIILYKLDQIRMFYWGFTIVQKIKALRLFVIKFHSELHQSTLSQFAYSLILNSLYLFQANEKFRNSLADQCIREQIVIEMTQVIKVGLQFKNQMKQILGLQVNSIENALLSCAVFFLILYIIAIIIEKKPKWFLSQTLRQTIQLEDKFQKLFGSRRDILHHYYWARSENDSRKMKQMDKDLARVDIEIQQLREEYKKKKSNLTTIVQKLF